MKRFRIASMLLAALIAVLILGVMVGFAQTTGDNPPAPTDWFLVVLGVLFTISEILALIPGVASNSAFMLLANIVRKLLGKPPLAAAVPQNTQIYGQGK